MPGLFPLLLGLMTLTGGADGPANAPTINDFALQDHQGRVYHLSDFRDRKAVVVVFLGVDCPIAELYAPRLKSLAKEFASRGVGFLGIDSNEHDCAADIARYAGRHELLFPLLKDPEQKAADLFGARRTPEAFVLDARRVVRYRGRIDDQYAVGGRHAQPRRRDLALALEQLLAGLPIAQSITPASGCVIERPRSRASGHLTYCRDIAPILQEHCVLCHRPGRMAPFSLLSYSQTRRRADSICLAIDEGRMPPWHADARYGKFANDIHLTDMEKQTVRAWVRDGCPEGNATDLPPTKAFSEGWSIPQPDAVVSMPERFTVPAEGVVEYQFIEADPGFREDKWVRAAEIRPGNRAVVHHCSVFLKAPGSSEIEPTGELGSFVLEATAVGTPPSQYPDGMAKRIPAGSRFVFVVHYTPIGRVQTDQTCIGLVFANPKKVQKEVATKLLVDEDLCIPPHAADHRVEKSCRFPKDALLLSFFPHMHLRGKSFRYEADYPDGSQEILLDVPRYDFNWQNKYVLAEPKFLPAGTVLRCVAHYDNSRNNPNNPDPDATVRAGKQSWDEMFNGYFDFVLAEQDLTQPPSAALMLRAAFRYLWTPLGKGLLSCVCVVLLLVNRCRWTYQALPQS